MAHGNLVFIALKSLFYSNVGVKNECSSQNGISKFGTVRRQINRDLIETPICQKGSLTERQLASHLGRVCGVYPSRSMYATFAIVGMLLHFTIEPYDGKNRYLYGFIDGAFYNVCKNRGFYGSRCLVIIYSGNLQGCTRFTHIYRP